MIDIKYEIFEFDLYNQASKVDCFKTKTYVKAPEPMGWVSEQHIGFLTRENAYVKMDLAGVLEGSRVIRLYWKNFSNAELIHMSSSFDLQIKSALNSKSTNSLIAEIPNQGQQLCADMSIVEASEPDLQYVAIYHLSRADKVFDAQLYVHGIWKISMPADLRVGLFSKLERQWR